MNRVKLLLYLAGFAVIACGYYLLSVSPDTLPDEVVRQVRRGMFAVWGGALLMSIGLLRRS